MDPFHQLYFDSAVPDKASWLGHPVLKCPLDLWVYQEIVHEVRPDVIIRCGTAYGGTALFLASMLDIAGKGKIITVDIEEKEGRPKHPRITYLHGSSTSRQVVEQIRRLIRDEDRVMVLLDSDHTKDHILAELKTYRDFVTPGGYLIVEDTIIGHPVLPDFGPGPMEAAEEFLSDNPDFASDRGREKFYLTLNPKGYLGKK